MDRARVTSFDATSVGVRELMAVREIARAFLIASRPSEVYQLALESVSPLVGATFACVYLVVDDSDLMRLQAVYNWPARYSKFLGDMRVRLGSGPSGQAASERRVVEVPDVHAETSLEDWREVANELGFRSLVALPLESGDEVLGTITFYFAASTAITTEGRGLLRLVADQIAATAEKAKLIDDTQRANATLRTMNEELDRQNRALVEARRVQDEFLANVSHELRTPLTAVMGYLALIEEGITGPVTPEQQDTLLQAKASSDRLLEIIGDLLELASLKRDEVPVTLSTFSPRDPLAMAVTATSGRKEGVSLVVDEPADLPAMTSDRAKVTRIVSALLTNACKFTERGEIRASVSVRDRYVTYRVEDTGIGISENAQHFVFDEFRQEDGSATRKYGGSGLGLAIARRLAKLLGGDIGMSSERGKGSTFELTLPLTR